jgi:hypothetical protein
VTGSLTISGSITATNGITISGSIASASFAATASSADNFLTRGTLTAQTLVVQTVTSSIIYSSGSNVFGNSLANTQTFTGSVYITGSIGIGTNTPDIFGRGFSGNTLGFTSNGETGVELNSATGSGAYLDMGAGGTRIFTVRANTTNTNFSTTTGSMLFTVSGSDRMFISSSGNVGMGTTTPSDPFVVQTNINAQRNVTFQNINTTDSSTRQGLYLNAGNRTLSFLSIHNDHNYIQGTTGANMYFQQTAGGTINMTISASGWVGIGTSTPLSQLHVYGSTTPKITITNTNYPGTYRTILGSKATAAGVLQLGNNGDNYIVGGNQATGGDLRFYVNSSTDFIDTITGTEAMRITNAGTITIGDTNYSPYLKFRTGGGTSYHAKMVTDNANDEFSMAMGTDVGYAYGPYIHQVGKDRYGTNTAGWIDYSAGNASSNTTYGYHAFATANTLRMQISYNGAIGTTAGGTNIYNPSDVRLKKNIVEVPYGLNEILNLKPSKFNWKEGFSESESDKDMLGFIAQEVQTVIPEAVESFGQTVTVKTEDHDYNVENPLRVNEKFIIPVLVKAIQELTARVQELENK